MLYMLSVMNDGQQEIIGILLAKKYISYGYLNEKRGFKRAQEPGNNIPFRTEIIYE